MWAQLNLGAIASIIVHPPPCQRAADAIKLPDYLPYEHLSEPMLKQSDNTKICFNIVSKQAWFIA